MKRDYDKELEALREKYKHALAPEREIIKRQARMLELAKQQAEKK